MKHIILLSLTISILSCSDPKSKNDHPISKEDQDDSNIAPDKNESEDFPSRHEIPGTDRPSFFEHCIFFNESPGSENTIRGILHDVGFGLSHAEQLTIMKKLGDDFLEDFYYGPIDSRLCQSADARVNERTRLTVAHAGSLESIGSIKGLKHLILEEGEIVSFYPLVELPGLESLQINESQILDASDIRFLAGLKSLDINKTKLENADFVKELVSLESLWISACEVSELPSLTALKNLTFINLFFNDIVSLGFLSDLSKIQHLDAGSNKIKDLSPIGNMSNLVSLSLNSNEISDVSSLSNLSLLKILSLGDNEIVDISPLAGNINLKILELFSNKIENFTPLYALTNLSSGSFTGNPVGSSVRPTPDNCPMGANSPESIRSYCLDSLKHLH